MEKIYNIVKFDPDGYYGSETTYYHVKCTEAKVKEIIEEFNEIIDPYGCSWSYNEMKLTTLIDIEKAIEKNKLDITSS